MLTSISIATRFRLTGVTVLLAIFLTACVTPNKARMGMVRDAETGILYGSSIERNLLFDATFFNNRKIKLRVRNTSGDLAFDIANFEARIADAYRAKGYIPTQDEDFGLLVDVNIMESSHIETDMAAEYAFIGAAVGNIAGAGSGSPYGQAVGTIAGAAIGSIIGAYDTEDTYIIVARATFGVIKKAKRSKRRVTFSRSARVQNIDDPDEDDKVYNRGFKQRYTTGLAVYAGGSDVEQSEVAAEVKNRITRIIRDLI